MTRRDFLAGAAAVGTLGLGGLARAQGPNGPNRFFGRDVYSQILTQAHDERWNELPLGDRIGRVGMALVDTPYVGQTLESADGIERLTVNLEGLDCVTLFENCVAFARHLRLEIPSPEVMMALVQQTRYRNATQFGYASRLHYTSEWMMDNQRRRNVRIITDAMPQSVDFPNDVSYMSEHPSQYPALRALPELVEDIRRMEKRVSGFKLRHIPKDRVAEIEPKLQTGDIVGITTSNSGIDISHTGLCVRDEAGQLRFLNASSIQMKVVLGDRLSRSLNGKGNLGVIIARPTFAEAPAPKRPPE